MSHDTNKPRVQETAGSRHTPGPWRVGGRLMIYGADDHLVTRVYHNKQFMPARSGDASLIAAAPNLLALLKEHGTIDTIESANDWEERKLVAIQKAEGW